MAVQEKLLIVFAIVAVTAAQGTQIKLRETPVELALLLDTSRSVGPVAFKNMTRFAQDLVKLFDIGPTKTRVAMTLYGTHIYHESFNLDKFSTAQGVVEALGKLQHMYSYSTQVDKALKYVRENVLNPALVRPNVPKFAVVFSDGDIQSSQPLKRTFILNEAREAQRAGIIVIAVEIGYNVDYDSLYDIATGKGDRLALAAYGRAAQLRKVEYIIRKSLALAASPTPGFEPTTTTLPKIADIRQTPSKLIGLGSEDVTPLELKDTIRTQADTATTQVPEDTITTQADTATPLELKDTITTQADTATTQAPEDTITTQAGTATTQAPEDTITTQADTATTQAPEEKITTQADTATTQAPEETIATQAPEETITTQADTTTPQAPEETITTQAPEETITTQADTATTQAPEVTITTQAPEVTITTQADTATTQTYKDITIHVPEVTSGELNTPLPGERTTSPAPPRERTTSPAPPREISTTPARTTTPPPGCTGFHHIDRLISEPYIQNLKVSFELGQLQKLKDFVWEHFCIFNTDSTTTTLELKLFRYPILEMSIQSKTFTKKELLDKVEMVYETGDTLIITRHAASPSQNNKLNAVTMRWNEDHILAILEDPHLRGMEAVWVDIETRKGLNKNTLSVEIDTR